MKTITIHDDGSITSSEDLTENEKLNIGEFLFDQLETDGSEDDQYVFYTGINRRREGPPYDAATATGMYDRD